MGAFFRSRNGGFLRFSREHFVEAGDDLFEKLVRKVPLVICGCAIAEGLWLNGPRRGEAEDLVCSKSLEILVVEVDRTQRDGHAQFLAGNELREFVRPDVFAAKEGRANEQEAEMARFQTGLDFGVPLFSNENLRVLPALEVVAGAAVELFLQLGEKARRQFSVSVGIGDKVADGALNGRCVLFHSMMMAACCGRPALSGTSGQIKNSTGHP